MNKKKRIRKYNDCRINSYEEWGKEETNHRFNLTRMLDWAIVIEERVQQCNKHLKE